MSSKKPISIDEYRNRPYIDAQISELLDRLEDELVPESFDETFLRELLENNSLAVPVVGDEKEDSHEQ